MNKQELVQNIFRVERSRLRLTAQTVGDRCGVSKQAIADTERLDKTRTSIKTDLYKKLCKIYGLNEDKIYKMIARQRESEKTARKEARKWEKSATMAELQKMPEELKKLSVQEIKDGKGVEVTHDKIWENGKIKNA